MAIVNIKLRNSYISVVAEDQDRIMQLAEKLNKRFVSIAADNGNATDQKLAFIAGLMLEDEIDQLQKKVLSTAEKEDVSAVNAIEIVAETLDQVSVYLEILKDKIEKK